MPEDLLTFQTKAAADDWAAAYLADEEPGAYAAVTPAAGGWWNVDLFEADGYQINRPAPRVVYNAPVVAPRRPTGPFLG
jgi:hypothetical protein